jgi:hypothetical protein
MRTKRLDYQIAGLAILHRTHSQMAISRRRRVGRDFRIPAIVRSVLASGHDAVR